MWQSLLQWLATLDKRSYFLMQTRLALAKSRHNVTWGNAWTSPRCHTYAYLASSQMPELRRHWWHALCSLVTFSSRNLSLRLTSVTWPYNVPDPAHIPTRYLSAYWLVGCGRQAVTGNALAPASAIYIHRQVQRRDGSRSERVDAQSVGTCKRGKWWNFREKREKNTTQKSRLLSLFPVRRTRVKCQP